MKKLISILMLAMLTLSANAQISYDFVEAAYERVTIDAGFEDIDGDGPTFGGSFSFGENFFAFADFGFAGFDGDVDLNTQVFGVGYHTSGETQCVAKAAYLRAEVETSFADESENGYVVQLGGRGLFNEKFEWEANVDYTDSGSDVSGEVGVNGALRYHFGNNFSTDFFAATADDIVTYGINFRLNFSR